MDVRSILVDAMLEAGCCGFAREDKVAECIGLVLDTWASGVRFVSRSDEDVLGWCSRFLDNFGLDVEAMLPHALAFVKGS